MKEQAVKAGMEEEPKQGAEHPNGGEPEAAEPSSPLICPHCGAEFLPCSFEYKANLANGATSVMLVIGCSGCRKALAGQMVGVIQPKVSPLTLVKPGPLRL